MTTFEDFKFQACFPLFKISGHLFALEESWRSKFQTPPRCITTLKTFPGIYTDIILDNFLIIIGQAECPYFIFVHAVIDYRVIRVRRIWVEWLSHCVIPDQFLISVLLRNYGSCSNYILSQGREWFLTFKVICLVHIDIINVIQHWWILFDTFVEPHKWVVKVWLRSDSMNHTVESNIESIQNIVVFISCVIKVEAGLLASSTKSFFFPILVYSPKVVNSFIDTLVIAVPGKQRWSDYPESHILHSQLEYR